MNSKILPFILASFLISFPAFSKAKILHSRTEFFDIIFDENSTAAAEEIHACADDELKSLCMQYNVEPDFKIPVILTSATEKFNAHFSNFNSNHIVIYDTVPDDSMLGFSSTIKSTFIHELTHLVSTNAKNGFWKTAGKIFGDAYNPGYYLTMPSFFKEGASVLQESKDGEGRLNDGFFLHDLKQAKLSGKFPGFSDSFGARTIHPHGNASYIFGGAFSEHVIRKYGMDRHAKFWHAGINGKKLTPAAVFKKIYGVSMKEEWDDFFASIDVAGIEKNPDDIEGIEKSGFKEKSLHLYEVLGIRNGEKIIHDKTTASVYAGKKKIWTKTNLSSAKLSGNGKYILTSSIDENHPDVKKISEIYGMENGGWKKIPLAGTKEIAILEKNGMEFLACIKSISQKCFLEIHGLDGNFSLVASIEFSTGQIPYSLCAGKNGSIHFFLKDGLQFSLCRAEVLQGDGKESKIKTESFALGKMMPRQLYVADENDGKITASFSYVEGKSFPRLATAEISDDEIRLSKLQKDISGGIYTPVIDGRKIVYAAKFYDEGAIYKIDPEAFVNEISTASIKGTELKCGVKSQAKDNSDFTFSEFKKSFCPGQTIIPLSVLSSYYISPSVYFPEETDCLGKGSSYLLGTTVIKNNLHDTKFIALTAGCNPAKKAGGFGITFLGRSTGGNFTLTDTMNSIFDGGGLMQANNSLYLSSEFRTGRISRIIFSGSSFLLYGKDDMNASAKKRLMLSDSQLEKNYFYSRNVLSVSCSTKRKSGPRTHEISGFKFGANMKNVHAEANAKKEDSIFSWMRHYENGRLKFSQIYPNAEIFIPKILPLENKGAWTFNVPVRTYGSLFEFNDVFMTWTAEATLLSWEVQKGLGMIPLYAATISLKTFFTEELENGLNRNMEIFHMKEDFENMGKMNRSRFVGGSLSMILAGNTGALADPSINVTVACKMIHCLEGSNRGKTGFSVTSLMNFALF